jgi:transcriptional regulator with XRE-family HTH domain
VIEIEKILAHIKNARKEQKISQAQIAEYLGISQNSYKNIELGKTELKVRTMFQIFEFLQIDPFKNIGQDVSLAVMDQDFTLFLRELTNRQNRTEKELTEIKGLLYKLLNEKKQ